MHSIYKNATHICNKAKLMWSNMILVNNLSLVKYKLVDASARFLILERVSFPEALKAEAMLYQDTLVCVRPDQFVHDFHLEGDSPDD